MTLTPAWFLQGCWWADAFPKHEDPNSWTVITNTADASRLRNQVTGQVSLWTICSGYHKHNLVSSEGNAVCILHNCSTRWNRAQEVEVTPQVETVSAKHNPYLETKMLLGTPWIPSHCSLCSTVLNLKTRWEFKHVLHFSRCYNSGGTSMCVKIETCFFFPFWDLNSHMDHTAFNQDSENQHSQETEGDHSCLLLTPHTVFSQRIHTSLTHAGKREGERPLSQSCHQKCQSDSQGHDCHSSHWKGKIQLGALPDHTDTALQGRTSQHYQQSQELALGFLPWPQLSCACISLVNKQLGRSLSS